jgi:hypothetical protein
MNDDRIYTAEVRAADARRQAYLTDRARFASRCADYATGKATPSDSAIVDALGSVTRIPGRFPG